MKWGCRTPPNWTFTDFKNFINKNKLLDIGFEGLPWTWSNLCEEEGEIKQRLDRVSASVEWCEKFKDARVIHIENEASDHNVIPKAWGKYQVGSKGFRISRKIKQCRMALSAWGKTMNLNSWKEIKRIKEEMQAARARDGTNRKESLN